MRAVLAIILISFGLSSCDETKKVIDTASNVQLSGNYTVKTIGAMDVAEKAPTMAFDALEKRINGTTSCNRYFGSYSLDLYAIQFSEIASTEMDCGPEIMKVENAFLQALRTTGSFTLKDGVLTLYSKNDRSILLSAQKNTILEDNGE